MTDPDPRCVWQPDPCGLPEGYHLDEHPFTPPTPDPRSAYLDKARRWREEGMMTAAEFGAVCAVLTVESITLAADQSLAESPPETYDEADGMCPNCVTPWKCNGPHDATQTEWGRQHAVQPPAPTSALVAVACAAQAYVDADDALSNGTEAYGRMLRKALAVLSAQPPAPVVVGCDADDCTAESTVVADFAIGGRTMTRHYCDDHAEAITLALADRGTEP